MYKLAILLFFIFPQLAFGSTASLEGQVFPLRTTIAGEPLKLNGLGLRGVAWVKGFVAGVYVSRPTKSAESLISSSGAKRIRMKIMVEAPASELSKSLLKRVRKSESKDDLERLSSDISALSSSINSLAKLKIGDTVDLDYHPGMGLRLSMNDRPVGGFVGDRTLYSAILKIFVGDKAIDPEMKAGILSGV